jgi:glycosyltransferase involved in cell wall biosynthesis
MLRRAFLKEHPALTQLDGSPVPFLLFLGRIHPKKGCDLLLDAFAHIAGLAPELHLVFAGPDGEHLQQKLAARAAAAGISHRVHWIGMVTGDRKWGAFYSCEAFALPSHQENFGIAVAEALACGKPVLISDKVNIWEDLAQDRVAITGPDTPAGTLCTLRQWIALLPPEKEAMGLRALQCFHRRYDSNTSADAIVHCFLERAAQSGSRALVDKMGAHKPV